MNFLPIEDLSIETSLFPDEVRERLEAATRPPSSNPFKFGRDSKAFQGRLSGYSFELIRVIHYRNSFLPVIKGTIQANGYGSQLRATMRLHASVLIFICFWLGLFGSFAFMFVPAVLATGDYLAAIALFGLLLFIYLLCIGSFKFEAAKARNTLKQLLQQESLQQES